MTDNVKLSGPSMEARIAARKRNAGDVQHASEGVIAERPGPLDAHTNLHGNRGSQTGRGVGPQFPMRSLLNQGEW